MIIETLLGIAEKFMSLFSKFKQADRDRKDRLAKYFDEIGDCILKIVSTHRSEQGVTGNTMSACTELRVHAAKFRDVVGTTLDSDETDQLDEAIQTATMERAVANELASFASTDSGKLELALQQLEGAAGIFKGFAAVLRAQA